MLLRLKRESVKQMDINQITLEQLSGEQYELAELIGIEAYRKLVKNYGGGFIYICKADTVMKFNRNNEICERFNGYNYKELAKEYNLSEKTIREITAEKLKTIRCSPMDGQMKL